MKMRRVLVLSMLLLVVVAFGKTQAVAGEPGLKPIAKYEEGSLYKAGKFNVARRQGDAHENEETGGRP